MCGPQSTHGKWAGRADRKGNLLYKGSERKEQARQSHTWPIARTHTVFVLIIKNAKAKMAQALELTVTTSQGPLTQ